MIHSFFYLEREKEKLRLRERERMLEKEREIEGSRALDERKCKIRKCSLTFD